MATYQKQFVHPYPQTGYMDKPNTVSPIISQHLNNFVLTFESLEDFAVANSITPNPDVSGLEPTSLVAIQIGNDKYVISAVTDMDSLTDVDITNISNGQILAWNATTSKWENISIPSSISSLNDLSDVSLNSPSGGDVLKYDAYYQLWKNVKLYLDGLENVNITLPSDGQILKYDAATNKWVNANESGGGGGAVQVILTKTQYDALPASKLTDNKMYFITDWRDTSIDASDVSYDNTDSGLLSTNLQDAIDELLGV